MHSVTALFFGPLREIVGADALPIDVPDPFTGDAAFECLARRFPRLSSWRGALRLAVNREYVPFDRTLEPGDEISFLPPVSGG
ncbi:MAG TPA: MoaD/ThiS family protein [Bacteroidota bacterium]|nr:MoaD/ThiS family protein [Bacteroidota bacterium]